MVVIGTERLVSLKDEAEEGWLKRQKRRRPVDVDEEEQLSKV